MRTFDKPTIWELLRRHTTSRLPGVSYFLHADIEPEEISFSFQKCPRQFVCGKKFLAMPERRRE
jgi:hypothetical protein